MGVHPCEENLIFYPKYYLNLRKSSSVLINFLILSYKINQKSAFYPIKLIIPAHPGRATPSILIRCHAMPCHVPSVLHYYPQWCLQYFIKIHKNTIDTSLNHLKIDLSVLINLPPQGCILIAHYSIIILCTKRVSNTNLVEQPY